MSLCWRRNNAGLGCFVDADETMVDRICEQVSDELRAQTADATVAYRDSGRWVEQIESVAVHELVERATGRLQPQSTYLITGGFGGIGLTLAEHLATTYQARLILLSRTPLPPRDQWGQWLDNHPPTDPTSRRLHQIQHLEQSGGQVLPLHADITDQAMLTTALQTVRQQWGQIDGIFHTAGVVDDSLIALKTASDAQRVLAPKVAGTLNLTAALRATNLDTQLGFLMLFSSTSAIIAPPGQIDYVAANAFLNAYAQADHDFPVLAVDWGVWREVGMAEKAARGESGQPAGSPTDHPLLGHHTTPHADKHRYTADYRVN